MSWATENASPEMIMEDIKKLMGGDYSVLTEEVVITWGQTKKGTTRKRGRNYFRFPQELLGWFDSDRGFCDAHNPFYRREMRMISWRRML